MVRAHDQHSLSPSEDILIAKIYFRIVYLKGLKPHRNIQEAADISVYRDSFEPMKQPNSSDSPSVSRLEREHIEIEKI